MPEFSITIPSSSKSHPSNTNSSFRVRLPETIHLNPSKWVCGLSEIIYSNSFENLPEDLSYIVSSSDGTKTKYIVSKGNYRDIYSILSTLWNSSYTRRKRDASQMIQEEKEKELDKQIAAGTIKDATHEQIEEFKKAKSEKEAKAAAAVVASAISVAEATTTCCQH